MSEMVERVGMAIARHIHKDADYGLDGETAFEYRRDDFLGVARAAIEAMREPGLAIRKITTFEFAEVEWPKLIDAALSQSPSLLTFVNCACHDEASKRLCLKKNECTVTEAHSHSLPPEDR